MEVLRQEREWCVHRLEDPVWLEAEGEGQGCWKVPERWVVVRPHGASVPMAGGPCSLLSRAVM